MSKPIALIIVFVLLSLPRLTYGDPAHHPVTIVPHWAKGDRVELAISRTREKSADGQSMISGQTKTSVHLEVLRADKSGYLVGWTAGDTTFEVPSASESFLRQIVGLMKGKQIVLQISPTGTIVGVKNWEELRSETLNVLDELLGKTAAQPSQRDDYIVLSNLRKQWHTVFGMKEQVEQLCMRDARMYLMVLGRDYSFETPHEYEDQLPNPLGGEPFPAHTTIALKAFDPQSRQAVLTWSHSADPQQAARIVQSMVKDLATSRGKSLPNGTFSKTISIEDTAEITVDIKTGWIATLTRKQSVHLGTRGQTDRTSIVKLVH